MVPELRRAWNRGFSAERYGALLAFLEREGGSPVDFRVCETPVFLSSGLAAELEAAAGEIAAQVTGPGHLRRTAAALPARLAVPGESAAPVFLQLDFALALGEDGRPTPRLIELQAFPSLYGFQWLLARGYRSCFEVPAGWTTYFGGLDDERYVALLREVLVGDADPDQTVLLEITPERQKTRIDFAVTERLTGVRPVSVTAVRRRGRRLFYRRDGREVEIRRLYNRVIFDEAEREGLELSHVFGHELDVEWVDHPNWFFRISKFSLPLIESRWCPPCHFLADLEAPPADLERYVLKPLTSFAGRGVEVDPTPEKLAAVGDPRGWILQRKVEYAPLVETPDDPAKVEVRMMFLRAGGELRLVNSLVRMSKGRMIGVDFNRDREWVGASVALHE